MKMFKPWRGTVLGCIGLVIILWNIGGGVWNAATSTQQSVTSICQAAHYSITGCSQSDHSMSPPEASGAYIVTNVHGANNGVNQYRIVQQFPDGSTVEIANKSININVLHYVVALSDLWHAQGATLQPGTYELYTDYSNGLSVPYKLTITQPAQQPQPAPTSTGT